MEKYVAVRLRSQHHGQIGFSLQNANVINYALEKRDPALKNLAEALYEKGLEYSINGCNLYWFHIDDTREPSYYLNLREVEFAFTRKWFELEKARIRGYSGLQYIDACADIANNLTVKDQTRDISYELPSVA